MHFHGIQAVRRRSPFVCLFSLSFILGLSGAGAASDHWTQPFNVVWTTPGKAACDSMPLGNGVVGVNLWVEAGGDLVFYISRNDALSEVSQLCKVGRVRVSLQPNPFAAGQAFRQELVLKDGVCAIDAGSGSGRVQLKLFVDSELPVVHLVGEAGSPMSVKATVESWRTEPQIVPRDGTSWALHAGPFELHQSADVFPTGYSDAAVWYHRNEESTAFKSTIELQSLQDFISLARDPLLHRTFGGWITGPGFKSLDNGRAIGLEQPRRSFALRVAAPCLQGPDAQVWLNEARRIAKKSSNPRRAMARTADTWREFWDRSWILPREKTAGIVPGSEHPLRFGIDSNGQNRFRGKFGRLAVLARELSQEEMRRLAEVPPASNAVPPSAIPELQSAFTLEAWINPDEPVPGRIFDRLTAGGSDGFLFDTHPGETLRLIVGARTLSAAAGILKTGQWQHVAATFDAASGRMAIYLNGQLLTESGRRTSLASAYTLQRYTMACAAGGPYPIKFNGSIFTVEPAAMGLTNTPDWRRWGDCHWWQNVRLPPHAMLAAGDFEMMDPLFRLYESARPLAEARTFFYRKAQGCYFPETMTVWGTYANGDYAWDRNGKEPGDISCPWWQYAWNQGPELVALMLDRWDYTRDRQFLKKRMLPMADAVLKYFDTGFRKDADGKIVLDPTQSVETYWYGVTNDMPTTAGLHEVTRRLCALPPSLVAEPQRAFFARMRAACPEVPIEVTEVKGEKVRRLGPAQQYNKQRSNVENPELYAVWPFRLYGVGKPDLDIARAAYETRGSHLDVGWGYDGTCAALLGLTDEAARIMAVKTANSHPAYRWPATWGPNFDWLPDQDHGANLLLTTQLMLLQSDDGPAIRLLPAWPRDWDVSFKLRASGNTIVECVYRGGKVERLVVTPRSRLKDVVNCMK